MRDDDGNLLPIDTTIEDSHVTLINIYGPNADNPGFYEKVRKYLFEFRQ